MLTFSLRSRFILCPHHPWIVVHPPPILLTIMLTFSLRSHFILCPHHLSFVVHPSPILLTIMLTFPLRSRFILCPHHLSFVTVPSPILLTIMLTYFSLGSRPFCYNVPTRSPPIRARSAHHFALLFLPFRFHIRTILLLPVFTLI